MDDNNKPQDTFQSVKNNRKLLWGAIALGLVALIAGIFFYMNSNNGGPSVGNEEEPQSLEAALEQTASRLTALRGRLESEEVSEEIIEEIVDMREDLERASKDADEETLAMWRTLDENLRAVEETLRAELEKKQN